MDKFLKNIIKTILIIFSLMLIWIIEKGILEYNKIIYDFNPVYLVLLISAYILFITMFYKYVIPNIIKYKWIIYLIFALFSILTLVSGVIFRVNPSWDMGTTFEIAKELVEKGTYTNSFYLARFPNNIMMTIIDIVIIKIMNILNITDQILGISIVTSCIIILSVIFLYKIAKKIYGDEKALLLLLICMFTTPLYMYASEYYTDTYSILPTVMLVWIWLKIKDKKQYKKKILWQVLFSLILFFALKLKITASFVFIAIIIYEICNKNLKNFIIDSSIIIPLTMLLTIAFNMYIVPKFALKEERELYEIPVYHWIMMGMNELGGFSYDEYAYTQSFKTYDERKQADINKIIERIKERNLNTHIKNISAKMCFAWHDGTYWSASIVGTEIVHKGIVHEFVLSDGKYNHYYKYIPQVLHFAMLIFIVLNIVRIIRQKDYKSKDIIFIISTFGIMVFLIIWENRSRYVFTMILIMLIAQINGIDYLSNMLDIRRSKNEKNINSNTNVL